MKDTDYEIRMKEYLSYLQNEERSPSTIKQYLRDIRHFFTFIEAGELTRGMVLHYKQTLENTYRPVSVNAKLSALNSFFSFLGRDDLKLRLMKIQKSAYCSAETELSKSEYLRLIKAAEKKESKKLSLLLQTICSTGIRVSELKYITVEALNQGEAVIRLKGKTRTILIPRKLQKKLNEYVRHEKILSGTVFITKTGRPLDRSNIWKMMKALCKEAGIDGRKVFPHNLRHLFARCFYSINKDIAKLADILGHSNINTTRIYIISSGAEHRRRLDALGLVI